MPRAIQLEHQRLAVAVVEAGAQSRTFRRSGHARLPGHRIAVAPHRGGERPSHQPDLSTQQRAIHLLPHARRACMGQRGERAAERQDRTGFIRNRHNPRAQRLPRLGIRLGNSAQRLRHRIRARQIRVRSLRPIAGDRHIHQPRIDAAQLLVAEAVLLGRTRTEVLSEYLGTRDQLVQYLAPLLRLQVERDALHAAVVGFEVGARHTGQHGAAARIVAALGHLDLDHLGAEIGHQHVGHRARLRGRARDNLDALKRTVRFSHVNPPDGRQQDGPAWLHAGPAPPAYNAAWRKDSAC